MHPRYFAAIAISIGLSATPIAALAAAGGDSTTGGATTKCKTGEVYNKQTKKCEKKEAVLDQDSIFEGGRDLAYAGRYEEAISVLLAAPQLDDKRVLNLLGFANRKLGRLDTGIAYYQRSMAKDPNYALVREYYGEALLQKNDVSGARQQLAEIERICGGTDCEPYAELADEIARFEKSQG